MPILNTLIDLFLRPFRRLPPELGLVAFSVLLGLVVLWIFKAASDPGRILRARNRAVARLLEVWLYRSDPWVSLGAVARGLRDNARYLGTMALPMLACLLPALLLLAQARDWFGARPLRPGETVLVVASVKPDAPADALWRLELSDGTVGDRATGVRVKGPPVRSAARREIAWQVQVEGKTSGCVALALTDPGGGIHIGKELCVGPGLGRVSRCRVASVPDWLLNPGEPRLPASQPLARFEVLYPAAEYNFLGLRMGWLPAVLLLSLLAGVACRKPLGVEF